MRTLLFIGLTTIALVVSSARTRGERHGTGPVASAGQTNASEYRSRSGHFVLRCPSDWLAKPTKEYTLLLERESTAGAARITVDVPYIPPHLPGMVTMKRVVNGYLDDQKKRLSDVNVVERRDDRLGGNAAHRLVVTGRERGVGRAGGRRTIVALIAIRNEQVYVLEADATPDLAGIARDAMSSIEGSWDWTK